MKIHELGLPKSEIVKIADEWIFKTRNKSIFFSKIEGFTYEEVAEMYNLSVVRTKEIVKECFDTICKHA